MLVQFEKYFGVYSRTDIVQTYRNSQELLNISGKFVMRNEYQMKKNLYSKKNLKYPVSIVWYADQKGVIYEDKEERDEITIERAFCKVVDEIVQKHPQGDILLLGRNNRDLSFLANDEKISVIQNKGETQVVLDDYPNIKIKFLTVHRAKGLEADNVIILNAKNARSGFPNQIVDDPILNLLRGVNEQFPFAEERRLFYVALTRTKNYTYILAPSTSASRFVDELSSSKKGLREYLIRTVYYDARKDGKALPVESAKKKTISCPICKCGTLVKRRGLENKEFVGCSNFPACTYTAHDLNVVRKNNRCPICDNFLIRREGDFGEFMGCMSYPYCTYTENIDKYPNESLKKEI